MLLYYPFPAYFIDLCFVSYRISGYHRCTVTPHPRTVNPKFPINLYHRVAAKKVCFSFGKIWYTYNIYLHIIYIYMFFFQLYFSRYYVEEHVHGTFETDPREVFWHPKKSQTAPVKSFGLMRHTTSHRLHPEGDTSKWYTKLVGGNSNILYFHPLFGEDEPNLTHIFQMGWNHQPPKWYTKDRPKSSNL